MEGFNLKHIVSLEMERGGVCVFKWGPHQDCILFAGTQGLAVTYCCHGEEENKMMAIAQKCGLSLSALPRESRSCVWVRFQYIQHPPPFNLIFILRLLRLLSFQPP